MRWQRINRLLRPTGFKVVRVEQSKPPKRRARGVASDPVYDRLVPAPVFILASIRSGSTLLRVLLNTHSQLHAPHELHLPGMRVELGSRYAMRAIEELGLDPTALDYLLWDRLLHRELTKSGKKHIVEKTPSNVFIWRRIVECWPDARFIFLLRHPVAIARSRQLAWGRELSGENQRKVLAFMNGVERARRRLDGLTIRYEDLTTDPERVTQDVCAFLGVEWEPEMLDYGRVHHGTYEAGLGDWGERIRSGEILAPRPLPEGDIPERLLRLCRAWGYVEKPAAAGSASRR